MKFVSIVEDVFSISGRGAVLVLPKEWGSDARIRVGDMIQLRTPDGRIFETHIHGVEFVKKVEEGCVAGIMLPREISRSDIPNRTEIWLIEN